MKHLVTVITAIAGFGAGYLIANNQKAPPAPVETIELSLPTSQQQTSPTQPIETISPQTRQKAQTMAKKMVTDNKDATINKLLNQISQLESQLELQAQQFQDERQTNIDAQSVQNTNPSKTADEPDTQRTISKEEAQQRLPKPFSNALVGRSGTFVKNYDDFHQETRDYDWALLMENNIKDFITMHEMNADVRLEAVSCKTNTCEIMGFEYKDKIWEFVFAQMRLQDWWQFQGIHSSSTSNGKKSYFYVLTSRKM